MEKKNIRLSFQTEITLTEKEKMETIYYENEALETCVIASLSMKG